MKKQKLIITADMSEDQVAEIQKLRAERRREESRNWHKQFASKGVSLLYMVFGF